jgi:hypothetical protein
LIGTNFGHKLAFYVRFGEQTVERFSFNGDSSDYKERQKMKSEITHRQRKSNIAQAVLNSCQ